MRNLAFINLDTLKKNAEAVKEKLKKSTKHCAVVKADAYGHGSETCANALYNIADCFAVAIAEEGIRLRLSGIRKDILILTPAIKEELFIAVENGFTLTVQSIEELKSVNAAAEHLKRAVKVHIKYDTGMRRYGAESLTEIEKMLNFAKRNPAVIVDGVYSHLYNTEDIAAVKRQKEKFLLANNLVKGYNSSATAHLSASGGFLLGEEFDMVRIGILLYGYKPFPSEKVSVKPVMKIYSPVTAVRSLKKGESALYGKRCAEKDTDIFLVRYGYADGLFRSENEDIYNNRCMDVSAVKGTPSGRWACVLKNADELAKKCGTISYEILTKAAIRAEKIYVT